MSEQRTLQTEEEECIKKTASRRFSIFSQEVALASRAANPMKNIQCLCGTGSAILLCVQHIRALIAKDRNPELTLAAEKTEAYRSLRGTNSLIEEA